ncbi:MAG: tyrosine-type recombinase/integrase [Lysobacteraceae bacterium]
MRIFKPKGDRVWSLDYTDPATGKRRRVSLGTTDRSEAERKAHDVLRGTDEKATHNPTLAEALEARFESYWKHKGSPDQMFRHLRKIRAEVGAVRVSDVTRKWMDDYVAARRRAGNSGATINRKLSAIRSALKALDVPTARTVPKPVPEAEGRIRYLSREEEQDLMDAITSSMIPAEAAFMRAFVALGADTGGRTSELLDLAHNLYVPAEQGRPPKLRFLKTKGRRERTVPLTPRADAAWREFTESPLWQTTLAGRTHNSLTDWVYRLFCRARDAAGLQDVNRHTLRHTCATRLVQAGMPLAHVQRWMGHRCLQTTMRYVHLGDRDLYQGVELLSEPVPESPRLRAVG